MASFRDPTTTYYDPDLKLLPLGGDNKRYYIEYVKDRFRREPRAPEKYTAAFDALKEIQFRAGILSMLVYEPSSVSRSGDIEVNVVVQEPRKVPYLPPAIAQGQEFVIHTLPRLTSIIFV